MKSSSENVKNSKENYTETQDTSEYKRLRVQAIKEWPNNKPFAVENQFIQRVKNLSQTFIPFQFQYLEETTYNLLLSLFLDTLDFLPRRPDLSFDFVWRAIDTYSSEVYPNISNKDAIQKCINEIWIPALKENVDLLNAFNSLFINIPVQSCEYLYKRLYQTFDNNKYLTRQNQLVGRVIGYDGGTVRNQKVALLIAEVYNKFNYNPQKSEELRKGSRLLYRLFRCNDTCNDTCSNECNGTCKRISFAGIKNESVLNVDLDERNKVTIDIKSDRNYQIELEDKINLLINGILYTFRNDRAHGAVFSPFRSSKASIKTYAHSNFCFLAAYILLLILMSSKESYNIKSSEMVENIACNIELFKKLYGNSLKD